jgi:ketosteroid isomerase-like protein
MRRLLIAVMTFAVLSAGTLIAQEEKHEHEAAPAAKRAKLDRVYLQKVLDAFGTLEPKNAAKYYGKGKEHVFFDVTPMKYNGWAEYEKGTTEFFKSLKSAKFTMNDDLQIHHEGGIAWSLATGNIVMVDQSGKSSDMPYRWTAIWHNHGGNWIIAHEHVSVPLPDEPAKQ